jgi:hypothetical protein
METGPHDTLPQSRVEPHPAEEPPGGPTDWDDFVTHTGEARSVADTACHSLEPDAPTLGAAARGHEIAEDLAAVSELPSSSTGPD